MRPPRGHCGQSTHLPPHFSATVSHAPAVAILAHPPDLHPVRVRERSTDADLCLQEREAFCGQRRGVISIAVSCLPQAVVSRRLDRTKNEIGDDCRPFRGPSIPSSRDLAAPDEDVELAEDRLLGRVCEPGDADSAVGRLEDAPGRRTMLLDRTPHFPNTLQHTFGRQLIE